jgi:hypothetical protein
MPPTTAAALQVLYEDYLSGITTDGRAKRRSFIVGALQQLKLTIDVEGDSPWPQIDIVAIVQLRLGRTRHRPPYY